MAKIKTLYQNGQQIMPVTHPKAIMDDDGISLDVVLAQLQSRIAALEEIGIPVMAADQLVSTQPLKIRGSST